MKERLLPLLCIGVLTIAGVALFFVLSATASTDAELSHNQVAVTYYKGLPTSRLNDYDSAIADGDAAVEKVTFTTKSLDRLSWGEPDDSGEYAMYFDAADIHRIAIYLNETGTKYEEVYELYRKAASSLYD